MAHDEPGSTVVRRAGRDDLDEMAAVLGEAFADYPATRWTVDHRDHVARVTGLQRLSLDRLGLPYGEAWVVEIHGAIASVAVWMDGRVAIPASVWPAMAGEQRALEGDRAAASIAVDERLDGLRPDEPHLYLGAVGTRPDAQGRGLARLLLAVLVERAEREDQAIFLETSTEANVARYGALGFGVTRRIDIPGGPTTWGMLRPRPSTR